MAAEHRMENSANIAYSLSRMAQLQPDTAAVVMAGIRGPGRRFSYRELDDDSDRIACGLREVGIGAGTRTVLMVPPSHDFFALAFALFKIGAVLVAVDPGLGFRNLGRCLKEAEPQAFIGIPQAQLARVLFRWGTASIKINIVTGSLGFPGILDLARIRELGTGNQPGFTAPVNPHTPAAILFTSGSTGTPKGVLYTHGNFAAQIRALQQEFDIQPGEVDLATFPLFALFAPALGMTSVIPAMDFTRPGRVDPRRILDPIRRYGITNLFGSPALLDRVGRWAKPRGIKLAGLRRILSAGAPVHARIMERFCSLLDPGVQVFSAYGATESLPVCSIGSDEVLSSTGHLAGQGKGVCVGRPVQGLQVGIIAITDERIPAWEDGLSLPVHDIGEIIVRGPQVTQAYYNHQTATALSKIYLDDGSWYHRMGDLGYLDEHGRLWFCGRKSHRVETGDQTLYSIPCEGIFNTHPDVHRSALVGVPAGAPVRRPVICIELERTARKRDRSEIRAELLALGMGVTHTRRIRDILFHDHFPVDIRHNAKIDRNRLSRWAEARLG